MMIDASLGLWEIRDVNPRGSFGEAVLGWRESASPCFLGAKFYEDLGLRGRV